MKMSQAPLSNIDLMVNKGLKAFVMDEIIQFCSKGYGNMKEENYYLWLQTSMKSSTSYCQIPSSSLSHCFAQFIKPHCDLKGA